MTTEQDVTGSVYLPESIFGAHSGVVVDIAGVVLRKYRSFVEASFVGVRFRSTVAHS